MENGNHPTGIPIDATGGPTVDPTRNVLDLVGAAVKRLDDLRILDNSKANDEKKHIREILKIVRSYDEKLREAEAKRIDAIRAVDVNAVSVASERAGASATVLATQVQASAETLRSLVATSAAATAAQLTQIITPITDRLALLEKAQYTGAGKEGVTDPQLNKLLVEMEATRTALANSAGRSGGLNAGWVYLVGAVTLVGAIIAIFLVFAR